MPSSVFYPNCPRCENLGAAEYRSWRDGAYEVFSCYHCGFGFDWETRLDEEKSTPENPVYTETMEIDRNNFKIGIRYKNGRIQASSFTENVSEERATEIFKEITADPEVDADECYLSKWDAGKKEVVYLFGYPNVMSDEQLECCRTPEDESRYSNFEEDFHIKIN